MFGRFFNSIGKRTLNFFAELGKFSKLFGQILNYTPQLFKKRKLLLYQMEHIGVNSLPLVIIIAIFTGAVSAWQAAYQLKGVAPMSFLGTATSKAIITELGPVLTAIVIAGRVGASIAAELGSMKVTEQIDAMEVMGISPIMYLAMPRFYAAIFMMPILVTFANIIAVFGAFMISNFFLDISYAVFFDSVKRFFFISDMFFGITKGIVFGGVTALLGCYIGFATEGGAEGVGMSTIRSFVLTSALILILDYTLWTIIF